MSTRVALFATCLGNEFFAEACADTVRLLRHLGVQVEVPAGQTCCGQPAHNSGHTEQAGRMAAHTLDVLEGTDYIVLPSGSCAGMIRRVYPEIRPGPRTEALAARTFELAQFLVQVLGVHTLGNGLAGRRVAYHHGCHALRELGVREEPVALLRGAGAEVVPWEADEECCGFGGLFSTKLPEVSAGMADRKLRTLPDVDVVTSADGGCLMQLSGRSAHLVNRRSRPEGRAAKTGSPRGSGEPPPFRHLAHLLLEGARA